MFNKTNNTTTSVPDMAKKPTPSAPRSSVSNSAAPSILANDIIITGDIKTNGDVQIDGRLDGNVKANNVTIGEQGFYWHILKKLKTYLKQQGVNSLQD